MKPSDRYNKLLIKRDKIELQLQRLNADLQLKEIELKETVKELQSIRNVNSGAMAQ